MNGILLVDKPEGWTSHDVIAKLRGVLHERRMGHSGTLDPMATGLLVVFLGRATRGVEFAESHEKEYLAKMRLGVTTDTQDTSGNILSVHDAAVTDEALYSVLNAFKGDIMQLPPMYSAIKIGGRKLCDIARRGEEIERTPRPITVTELEMLDRDGNEVSLRVRCSKGTYIRTLCSDVGETLGCGAVMSALRRTMCGNFGIDDAHTMDEIIGAAESGRADELIRPLDSLFHDCAGIMLDTDSEKKCRCGASFYTEIDDGEYRAYSSSSGEFLALCRAENGTVSTIKSFFEV